MGKYIIRESELCSVIHDIVAEELSNAINEGFVGTVLKTGAKAVFAPTTLVQGAADKFNRVINKGEPIFKGAGKTSGVGSRSGSSSRSKRLSKSEKQSNRFRASRYISYEYGRPETVPGLGRRIRLDAKRDMDLPATHNQAIDWGDFGKHFHDEADDAWYRKVLNTENTLIRVSRGNQNRQDRLIRKYKKGLVDWLKERDKAYRIYVKDYNSGN